MDKLINLLSCLLNGHLELSEKIVTLKYKLEMEDIIEINFINWLTYDMFLRNKLGIMLIEYNKLSNLNVNTIYNFIYNNISNQKYRGFDLMLYIDYYDKGYESLKINPNDYTRNHSLKECFNSNWWKTTEKNSIPWRHIHKFINSKVNIKIYKDNKYEFIYSPRSCNKFNIKDNNNLVNPTIKQKYYILERVDIRFNFDNIKSIVMYNTVLKDKNEVIFADTNNDLTNIILY